MSKWGTETCRRTDGSRSHPASLFTLTRMGQVNPFLPRVCVTQARAVRHVRCRAEELYTSESESASYHGTRPEYGLVKGRPTHPTPTPSNTLMLHRRRVNTSSVLSSESVSCALCLSTPLFAFSQALTCFSIWLKALRLLRSLCPRSVMTSDCKGFRHNVSPARMRMPLASRDCDSALFRNVHERFRDRTEDIHVDQTKGL